MKKQIRISNLTFNTQKECETYVRNLLTRLGVTESVKETNIDDFDFLFDFCKRYPDYNAKFYDFKDFKITQNVLNKKTFQLNIINNDDSIISISWRDCVTQKPTSNRTLFISSLRECINTQILDFKNSSDLSQCKICDCSLTNKNIHIDHHEPQFSQIVHNFLEQNQNTIIFPETYTSIKLSNQTKFKDCDNWIGDLFAKYHYENAVLRVSCEECNLKRPKCLCIIDPSPQ